MKTAYLLASIGLFATPAMAKPILPPPPHNECAPPPSDYTGSLRGGLVLPENAYRPVYRTAIIGAGPFKGLYGYIHIRDNKLITINKDDKLEKVLNRYTKKNPARGLTIVDNDHAYIVIPSGAEDITHFIKKHYDDVQVSNIEGDAGLLHSPGDPFYLSNGENPDAVLQMITPADAIAGKFGDQFIYIHPIAESKDQITYEVREQVITWKPLPDGSSPYRDINDRLFQPVDCDPGKKFGPPHGPNHGGFPPPPPHHDMKHGPHDHPPREEEHEVL